MKWNQSDRKVITIVVITGSVLYALYKGLQFLAGVSMGASFGVGLGEGSGSKQYEESRKVATDAPIQVIYRIDNSRFLTLENYISCDRGGQVYYNDILRGIKNHLGWDIDFNDSSYSLSNSISAYQGYIINGANNGFLAFPGASTSQYCGSGNSSTGCPVFLYFSSDYGKTFIYKIVAMEKKAPERFSKLKVVVANDGVYLRDESKDENYYSRPTASNDLYSVNKFRLSSGKLINVYADWQEKVDELVKEELIRKKIPYANEYGPEFHIFDYTRSTTPPKTHGESNSMANELSDIRMEIKNKVYSSRIKFPVILNQSKDANYLCNKGIKAKVITYTNVSSGIKEEVKNEQ